MQDTMIRLLITEHLTLIVMEGIDILVKDQPAKESAVLFDTILMEELVQVLTSV